MIKLWPIAGGGDEIMPGRGWSWVVAAKLWLSWLVVDGRGWSHDLVMPAYYKVSTSTKQHVCSCYNGSFSLTFGYVKFRLQFGHDCIYNSVLTDLKP